MKSILVPVLLVLSTIAAPAQIAAPPVPSMVPPPPPPPAPPPPKIEVPQVPKMDAPVKPPQAAPARRSSYHDRVLACLDDPYVARLPRADRTASTRGCADRAD